MELNVGSLHTALDAALAKQGLDSEATNELAAKCHKSIGVWVTHLFMRTESQLRSEKKLTLAQESQARRARKV